MPMVIGLVLMIEPLKEVRGCVWYRTYVCGGVGEGVCGGG